MTFINSASSICKDIDTKVTGKPSVAYRYTVAAGGVQYYTSGTNSMVYSISTVKVPGKETPFAAIPNGCSYIIGLVVRHSTILLVTISEVYQAPIVASGLSLFTKFFIASDFAEGIDETSLVTFDPTTPDLLYYTNTMAFAPAITSVLIPSPNTISVTPLSGFVTLPTQFYWSSLRSAPIVANTVDQIFEISIVGHGTVRPINAVLPRGHSHTALGNDMYYAANCTHISAVSIVTGVTAWSYAVPAGLPTYKQVSGNFVFMSAVVTPP